MAEESRAERERHLTLQALGITLLGVLVSIGATVGFGVGGAWWLRATIGLATTTGLATLVWLLGTRTDLLARMADWITGRSYRR